MSTKLPRVLVVEDDLIISRLLDHMLKRRGFEVQLASEGREAAALLESVAPPELVLLDIMLPFIDGFELIRHIRDRPDWKTTPIIMLTSRAQERHVVRALDSGASDYVVKPFQPEELMARVRRLVKGADK
ncbi:MAG: response regulator transcription factor [Blastocatellia bacterium]